MKTIDKKLKEEIILDILNDHIIWHRLKRGMRKILNAYHPGGDEIEFETDWKYVGYGSALKLMGVDNIPTKKGADIHENFYDILRGVLKSDEKSSVLAKRLYNDWLAEIVRFYTDELELKPQKQ
ncbi:hypothetical protein [Maribacter sp. 2307UL18-2]|uniref:hypothetical protein n=1 Tax=Maribacter sp. 2307UL18-2 TaxID=3386274 RepID=UPI0039BC99D0